MQSGIYETFDHSHHGVQVRHLAVILGIERICFGRILLVNLFWILLYMAGSAQQAEERCEEARRNLRTSDYYNATIENYLVERRRRR